MDGNNGDEVNDLGKEQVPINVDDLHNLSISSLIDGTKDNAEKAILEGIFKEVLDTEGKMNLFSDIEEGNVSFYETSDRNAFVRNFFLGVIFDSIQNKEDIKVLVNGANKISGVNEKFSIDIKKGEFTIKYADLERILGEPEKDNFKQGLNKYLDELVNFFDFNKIEYSFPSKNVEDILKGNEAGKTKQVFLATDFDLALDKNGNGAHLQDLAYSLRNLRNSQRDDISIIIQSDFIEDDKIRDISNEIKKKGFGFAGESDIKNILADYKDIPEDAIKYLTESLKGTTRFNELKKVVSNMLDGIKFNDKNYLSGLRRNVIKIQNETLKKSDLTIFYPEENKEILYAGDQSLLEWIKNINSQVNSGEYLNSLLQHILISLPGYGKSHLIEKIIPSILNVPVVMWNPSNNTALLGEIEKKTIEVYNSLALKGNVIFYFSEASTVSFLQNDSHEAYQTLRGFFQDFIQNIKNEIEQYPNVGFILATNLEKPLGTAIKDRFSQILLGVEENKEKQIKIGQSFIDTLVEIVSKEIQKNNSNITINLEKLKEESEKLTQGNKEENEDQESIYEYAGKLLPRDYFDKILPEILADIKYYLNEDNENIEDIDLGGMLVFAIQQRIKKAKENEKLTQELKNKTGLEVNNFQLINYGKYKQFINFKK